MSDLGFITEGNLDWASTAIRPTIRFVRGIHNGVRFIMGNLIGIKVKSVEDFTEDYELDLVEPKSYISQVGLIIVM